MTTHSTPTILVRVFLIAVCFSQVSHAPAASIGVETRADPVVRLPPTAFPQLPRAVKRWLQARRCTIPQASSFESAPHNVISGEFARRGQTDWAVLCSRNGASSLLVFWKGSVASISVVTQPGDDRACLQDAAGDRAIIDYSCKIGTVDREYILGHYEAYKESGAPKPPRITHQGIDFGYLEKASTVFYYRRGKWLELQGAD